jgi:hypothetical protein
MRNACLIVANSSHVVPEQKAALATNVQPSPPVAVEKQTVTGPAVVPNKKQSQVICSVFADLDSPALQFMSSLNRSLIAECY